jgi:hypothetical protein
MSARELMESHAVLVAERDGEIAQKIDLEVRVKAGQRVSTAIRLGRDPYSPIHPGFVGTNSGPIDAELEASRGRASQAYSTEVIAPIVVRIKQVDERIEMLRVAAADVWDRLEAEFPSKIAEMNLRAINETQAAVADARARLGVIRDRQARATAAKLDAEHAAEQHRLACAEALASDRELPDPPPPTVVETIAAGAYDAAIRAVTEALAKAEREARRAVDDDRAFRRRSERRRAESLARETVERAKNTGAPLGLLVEILSREVRS